VSIDPPFRPTRFISCPPTHFVSTCDRFSYWNPLTLLMHLHVTHKENEQNTLKLKLQTRIGENHIKRSFLICAPDQVLFRWACRGEEGVQGMRYAWRRTEMHTGFWWGSRKERYHYNLGVDRSIILKWLLQNRLWGSVLTIRRRVGISGGLLWAW